MWICVSAPDPFIVHFLWKNSSSPCSFPAFQAGFIVQTRVIPAWLVRVLGPLSHSDWLGDENVTLGQAGYVSRLLQKPLGFESRVWRCGSQCHREGSSYFIDRKMEREKLSLGNIIWATGLTKPKARWIHPWIFQFKWGENSAFHLKPVWTWFAVFCSCKFYVMLSLRQSTFQQCFWWSDKTSYNHCLENICIKNTYVVGTLWT